MYVPTALFFKGDYLALSRVPQVTGYDEVIEWCTTQGQERSGQLVFGQKAEKSSSLPHLTWEAFMDDVTKAAKLNITELKRLKDGDTDVQPVGRAAHKSGSYKEYFFTTGSSALAYL